MPRHHAWCFGCGEDNGCGLGLTVTRVGERAVRGEVTLEKHHQGAPGFAHGGVVAAVLDDALGMAMLLEHWPAVTAHLEVDYRRPVRLGRRLEVQARIDAADGRKIHMSGELHDAGELVAQARGLFLVVEPEHFLGDEPELPY